MKKEGKRDLLQKREEPVTLITKLPSEADTYLAVTQTEPEPNSFLQKRVVLPGDAKTLTSNCQGTGTDGIQMYVSSCRGKATKIFWSTANS